MLWTGGKDCALAMYEAGLSGCDIRCLATFAPPEPRFLAHPLSVLKRQAQSIGLPHYVLSVEKPWETGYEEALRRLHRMTGIDTVVTGDIAEVGGMPNWIRERTGATSMHAHMPLWSRDRHDLLQRLLASGFRAVVSCVDTGRLDARWVGRVLDAAAVRDLQRIREDNGLDLCGENGEYHTLVVDGPLFERSIDLNPWSTQMAGALAYMAPSLPALAGAA